MSPTISGAPAIARPRLRSVIGRQGNESVSKPYPQTFPPMGNLLKANS